MKIHIEIPTTRKVYGTTTFEFLVDDGTSPDEVMSLFNADKTRFVQHAFDTFDHEIAEEFDNVSDIIESNYEGAELAFPEQD